jgi:hypothetical protein
MAVLRFLALLLVTCWVVKLIAEAVTPMLPSLMMAFVLAVVVVVMFPRSRL